MFEGSVKSAVPGITEFEQVLSLQKKEAKFMCYTVYPAHCVDHTRIIQGGSTNIRHSVDAV